jgi:hypothetical protein
MLNERIEKLEWAVHYLLGMDIEIRNGVPISTALLNDGIEDRHNACVLQLKFKEFPEKLLVNTSVVAMVSNATDLINKIMNVNKDIEKQDFIIENGFNVNNPIHVYIMECFSRTKYLWPLPELKSKRLIMHTTKNQVVATWILEYNNEVELEKIVESVKRGLVDSGFNLFNCKVYPSNIDTINTVMNPIADFCEKVTKNNETNKSSDQLDDIYKSVITMFTNNVNVDDNIVSICKKLNQSESSPAIAQYIQSVVRMKNSFGSLCRL